MINNKLPADPTALILGILGLVIVFPGCCCGLLNIVSLILGVVGLVLATKSMKLYVENPEGFDHRSWSNVKAAKVINIITIVISALVLIAQIGLFANSGMQFSREFWENLSKNGSIKYQTTHIDSANISNEDENIQIKKQGDSLYLDTVNANNTTIK